MEKIKEKLYDANTALIERYRNGDREAGERLAVLNRPLVYNIASRFTYRHPDIDELCEIGTLGLVKAINSFNLTRGCAFSTYAVPLIFGEIRRFLRDDGIIKVSRENKRLSAKILLEKERRESEGLSTHISDIAKSVGVTPEEASLALCSSLPVRSLDECVYDGDEGEPLSAFVTSEGEEERTLDKIAIRLALERLTDMQRKIIILRYYKDLSQERCAKVLGITQVKVSREEKKILALLAKELS